MLMETSLTYLLVSIVGECIFSMTGFSIFKALGYCFVVVFLPIATNPQRDVFSSMFLEKEGSHTFFLQEVGGEEGILGVVG